jgi:hypothetical protein
MMMSTATTNNNNNNNTGNKQRPTSPLLLSKALNETFDEAFGSGMTTPKNNTAVASSSTSTITSTSTLFGGRFFHRSKEENDGTTTQSNLTFSSTGSLVSLAQFLYPLTPSPPQGSSRMTGTASSASSASSSSSFWQQESTHHKFVARMKHLSNVSCKFMEDSYSKLQKSNEKLKRRQSTINNNNHIPTLVLIFLYPVFIVFLAQLSQCNSKLVDAWMLTVLPATVCWKLLPQDWKERHFANLRTRFLATWQQATTYTYLAAAKQWADIPYAQFTAFRHETLGWYTATEIQSLQKDLQHLELHLQETKRQLVRCQQQHRAEQAETSEFQEQQLQQALYEAEREQSQILASLKEEHAQTIQEMKRSHEQALQKEVAKMVELQQAHQLALQEDAAQMAKLRQTLQGQETLLLDERRKVKAMKQSMDTLEQVAQRDAQHIIELQEQVLSQQRDHETATRELQTSYEQAWTKAKQQRQMLQETLTQESERLQSSLMQSHVHNRKLNRLLCQLLIVADDTNHYFFEDCDDLASIQDKSKVLQEAIEEAKRYVAMLKQRTQRDESLCLPHVEREEQVASSSSSSSSSVVSELTIHEREAILEVLSKDDYYDVPTDVSKMLKRSCMILLATAGLTTMATTSPRTLASLFASKK